MLEKLSRKGVASVLIKSCEDVVTNKSLLRKEVKNLLCLCVERDDRHALRMCSQLVHEPQTSDILGVSHTTMILKRAFALPHLMGKQNTMSV